VRAHCPYSEKGRVLAELQARVGVSPKETMAMGDTRGDIPMFERAGISVAVNPNHPQVAERATLVIPKANLRPLLDWMRRNGA